MSLLDDLQKELLKSDCDLTATLRKARVISHKLGLSEFEKWVNKELAGYESNDTIPLYRKNIHGKVKFKNPFHGLCPIQFPNSKSEDIFSKINITSSISKLLAFSKTSSNEVFAMPFSPEALDLIWENNNHLRMDTYLIIDKSTIQNIIEQVKNELLNWILLLEDKGIIGEGTSFSFEEKEKAIGDQQIINYITNIYGNVESSQLQQGTSNSNQKF